MRFKVVNEKLGEPPPEGTASALRVIIANGGGIVECAVLDWQNWKAGGFPIAEDSVEKLYEAGFLVPELTYTVTSVRGAE